MELKIGILYIGLHNELAKKYGVNNLIPIKEFYCKLGKHHHIPKSIRCIILIEMAKKNLIKKIDRYNIELLPCDINLENDVNKIYRLVGLY